MSDEDLIIDEAIKNSYKGNDVEMADPNEIVQVEFVFSRLDENYFHLIKTLVKPLFEFESVNIGGVADLILKMKENVGTAIKTEDDLETQNKEADIFGVFSMIPFNYFKEDPTLGQIKSFLLSKLDKYGTEQSKTLGLNILNNTAVGLAITERAINLPQEITPPAFNFLINEIQECIEDEDYDGKFNLDYVVIMSKYVIRKEEKKKAKKSRTENAQKDIKLFYNYETEYFLQRADFSFEYKIPYQELNLDYLENTNEPQYFNIQFIKMKEFVNVIKNVICKDSMYV